MLYYNFHPFLPRLAVQVIGLDVSCYLALPLVSVGEKFLLVVEKLLMGLGRELEVGTFDDRVHWARLLAESTVDTLGHVDIVTRCPSGAVLTLLSLNRDSLGRADSFTQLAGDAPLLPGRVAPQGMLSAEAGGQGPLLEGIVDCGRLLKNVG